MSLAAQFGPHSLQNPALASPVRIVTPSGVTREG